MMPKARKDKRKNDFSDIAYIPPYGKCRKKDFTDLLKEDKPNIILNILGLECDVSVSEVYSGNIEEINIIVNSLSKDIWIDRTYVSYPGNRFKDAFIKEDGWYKMVKILIRDMFVKSSKDTREEAMASLLTLSTYYLYSVLDKYGYDPSEIDINFKSDIRFETAYYLDKRTSWRF